MAFLGQLSQSTNTVRLLFGLVLKTLVIVKK